MSLLNKQNKKDYNIQDYIRDHRILAVVIIIFGLFIITTFVIILFNSFFNNSQDNQAEPENAPYITLEHKYLLETQTPSSLTDEIIFNTYLILLSTEELNTATINTNQQEIIASIDEDSWSTEDLNNTTSIKSMDITLSDGRKYNLIILFDDTYQNEYAVVVIKPLTTSNTHDYVITFTKNTSEYYEQLIKSATNSTEPTYSESSLKDHITGAPVESIPESTTKWIESLKLHNPEFIYSTLPTTL